MTAGPGSAARSSKPVKRMKLGKSLDVPTPATAAQMLAVAPLAEVRFAAEYRPLPVGWSVGVCHNVAPTEAPIEQGGDDDISSDDDLPLRVAAHAPRRRGQSQH